MTLVDNFKLTHYQISARLDFLV